MAVTVVEEVMTFIELAEEKFGAVVDYETVIARHEKGTWGVDANDYIVIAFDFTVDGEEYKFFIDSDTYGNGGYEWAYGETAEEVFAYFEADFLVMSEM